MIEPTHNPQPVVQASQLLEVTKLLQHVISDRSLLLQLTDEQQMLLLRAAEQVAHPDRAAKRKMLRAARSEKRHQREQQRQQDDALLDQTGIRRATSNRTALHNSARRAIASPAFDSPSLSSFSTPSDDQPSSTSSNAELNEVEFVARPLHLSRNCYICKQAFDRVHFFYDSLCSDCAAYNWDKRQQTADLRGRYALLTGGRVKIGFEAALKILRAGANLIVTTRFPLDAAKRFAAQADSAEWLPKLNIYGLDLRHTPSVEAFAKHLASELPQLDFVLNNACQTIRRPPGFYQHLLEAERESSDRWPEELRGPLVGYQKMREKNHGSYSERRNIGSDHWVVSSALHDSENSAELIAGIQKSVEHRGAHEWSQMQLLPEDALCGEDIFPDGQFDRDLQQVDLRNVNSWRLKLADVSTVELLEVQLVNAVAPFILNAHLKPLMMRVPSHDKHIVNVSAMEGVFYRALKRDTHPHTNMAKAALNMMTRTSAADYVKDGIHMNSVDTGWITDEDPMEITERKRQQHGFRTPLDAIDAAARICDPIFSGINTGEHTWGKFLKDYRVSSW